MLHFGVDFWLFPNYFIESNNPIDSFIPLMSCESRDDMWDLRTLILRLASITIGVYCAREILHTNPDMSEVFGSISGLNNDVFEWGQNKFLGVVDDS